MSEVLRILAEGVAALGAPIVSSRRYQSESDTPFKDDRRNLADDWLCVRKDMSKSIEKVKGDGTKTRCR